MFTVLFACVCINAGFWVLNQVDIRPVPLDPYDVTQLETVYNATALVDSLGSREDDYWGNIIDSLKSIWDQNIPFVEDFTEFLSAMGVSTFIIDMFKIPYRLLLSWGVVAWLRGG
jgi:hypothetical protein